MHMICMEAVIRMLLKKDVKGTVCDCFDLLRLKNKTMHFVAEHYFGCASALILLYCASALI